MYLRFNYIGSKKTLSPWIYSKLNQYIDPDYIFIDMFAGSGAMSSYMVSKGYTVHANDVQYYSYVILQSILANYTKTDIKNIKQHITELNSISSSKDNFIVKQYSPPKRMFFTRKNAMKIGAMRQHVEQLYIQKKINKRVYFYLLTCILSGSDLVANVATIYASYLKQFKTTAMKDIVLKDIDIQQSNNNNIKNKHRVTNKPAELVTNSNSNSILYLDPPYNQRNYSDNYDVLETIARNDEPELKGKTGLRVDNYRSEFSSKLHARDALKNILANTKTKLQGVKVIAMSYNSEGIMSLNEIKSAFREVLGSNPKVFKKKYKKFNSHTDIDDNKYVYEYLIVYQQ